MCPGKVSNSTDYKSFDERVIEYETNDLRTDCTISTLSRIAFSAFHSSYVLFLVYLCVVWDTYNSTCYRVIVCFPAYNEYVILSLPFL